MKRFAPAALLAGLCVALAATGAARADDQKVQVGKPAPAIDLPATQIEKALPLKKDAKTLSLRDLKGRNVVLFFYPKAMTPGCTVESCGFRDKAEDFAKLDTVLLGISTDTLDAQQKFTDKEHLPYPLLADTDKTVAKEYGVLNPTRGFANRVTFIIDKDGVVRKVYTKVTPKDHPDEVLSYVKEHLAK
jgi:peroxiredoxin Q/BCP